MEVGESFRGEKNAPGRRYGYKFSPILLNVIKISSK